MAAAGSTPIVAAPPIVAAQPQQTPVLVQGENGPVVMMIHGSIPHFAVPLNTMSSNPVMCEPTFHFKSPLVLNQFPSLITPDISQGGNQAAPTPIQIGSVIQGPQGERNVISYAIVICNTFYLSFDVTKYSVEFVFRQIL